MTRGPRGSSPGPFVEFPGSDPGMTPRSAARHRGRLGSMENPTPALPPAPTTPRFTLRRSRTDRIVGGVCGGLAADPGLDATLLRIGLVVLTVCGAGIGVVLYVAAWVLAPQAEPPA